MEADGATITFIFTGVDGEVIPLDATRVIIHDSVTAIPTFSFSNRRNIIEAICHCGVEEIENFAFESCLCLKRVIMPGVKVIGQWAFFNCSALTYVECGKLEVIEEHAFCCCESLAEINLLSVIKVEKGAFLTCKSITKATFGEKLESIRHEVFHGCSSLERITVPLKDEMLAYDIFDVECSSLKHINLIDEDMLDETAAALLRAKWRNDMEFQLYSINEMLPIVASDIGRNNTSAISSEIQEQISTIRHNIFCYKKEHNRVLKKATIAVEQVLPKDIVRNNVVPFLELPSHTFEGEDGYHWDWMINTCSSFESSEKEEDEDDLQEVEQSNDNEAKGDEEGDSNNDESSSSDAKIKDGRKRRRKAND